jgi:uncharacterized protein YggU (UPF0235/DUF167 family)
LSRIPAAKPWRHGAACVIVHFRLTPKSFKDTIGGVVQTADGPAFQAHVRAPPEDGAANSALLGLVAAWLDVPKRTIELATGAKSRLKALRISDESGLAARRLESKTIEFTDGR